MSELKTINSSIDIIRSLLDIIISLQADLDLERSKRCVNCKRYYVIGPKGCVTPDIVGRPVDEFCCIDWVVKDE